MRITLAVALVLLCAVPVVNVAAFAALVCLAFDGFFDGA